MADSTIETKFLDLTNTSAPMQEKEFNVEPREEEQDNPPKLEVYFRIVGSVWGCVVLHKKVKIGRLRAVLHALAALK